MILEEINILREKLNKQIEYVSLDNELILTLSKNLDDLINQYYRTFKNL